MLAQILFIFFVSSCFMICINAAECSSNLETDLIGALMQRIDVIETKMKLTERRDIALKQRETSMMRRIEYLQIKLALVEKQTKEAEKRHQTAIQQLQRDCNNQQEQTNKHLDIVSTMESGSKNTFNEQGSLYDKTTLQSVDEPNDTSMAEREKGMLNCHPRRAASEPVAFSAYLANMAYHLGIGQIIKYDGVLTNEGNTYNPTTGIFTCPQDGLYLIAFFISADHGHKTWVKLVVDGLVVSNAVAEVREGYDNQGGNVAILRLRAGQNVWTATFWGADADLASTSDFRHVTFSGVRLFD